MQENETKNKIENKGPEISVSHAFLPDSKDMQTIYDTEFIQETIKKRPIGRRKLVVRMLTTALMAVIFGVVASLMVFLMQPLFKRRLFENTDTQPLLSAFMEESASEELDPADLFESDASLATSAAKEAAEATAAAIQADSSQRDREIQSALAEHTRDLSIYRSYYTALREKSEDCLHSMVLVEGVSPSGGLFDDTYGSLAKRSGVIVSDTGSSYLILAPDPVLAETQNIRVTFIGGAAAEAAVISRSRQLPIVLLSVEKSALPAISREDIRTASLGSSSGMNMAGTPVIALGAPTGVYGSMMYGMITEVSDSINLPDASIRILGTDMYGSTDASGVLLSLGGQVLGFLAPEVSGTGTPNRITAYGISGLRGTIKALSEGRQEGRLGLYISDVPQAYVASEQLPQGVYVQQIAYDSPAREAGIHSGDIIVSAEGIEKLTATGLSNLIFTKKPGDVMTLNLLRSGADGYYPLQVTATVR